MAIATKTLTQSVSNNGYNSACYTYQCVVTENSYNTTNNTSNVTITFSIKGPWAPSFYEWDTNYGIAVDGVVKQTGSSEPYISTSYVQLLSWTGNITHNTDGKKSISVGVYLNQDDAANYLPKQYTSSNLLTMGSMTLTNIPRASSITSASNVTLGNACSIKWTPANSNFQYRIRFSLGDWKHTTGYIAPKTTNAYTYTGYTIPKDALLSYIPNSTTATMTATLYTYSYNNSKYTQIGSATSKTFTVTVPSDVKPTVGVITLTPESINGQSILVQSKNKLTVSTSGCSAGTGSSIKSYTFSGPGISATTTSTSVTSSSTLSNTGTLTYTVTVTDNRGRTNSATAAIECHEWVAPSIVLNAYRVESPESTEENSSGGYVRCSYELEYSSVGDTNDVSVTMHYRKSSETTLSDVDVLSDDKSTSASNVVSIPLDSTYIIYADISDNYGGSSKSNTVTMFSAERAFNIRPSGSGLALGKMAETDNKFDCKWPAHFDTTVCLGNKDHYNDGNTGVYLNPEGYIHLQRDSSFEYGPYLRFTLDDYTNVSCGDIRVNPSNKYMTFSYSERYLFEAGKLYSGNCQLATNKVLWTNGTGAYYPIATHTLNLNEKISEQANGIVIIFSKYSSSTILDENFAVFFIPKQFVTEFGGKFVILNMNTSIYSNITSKVLYISDTNIKGHANNSKTGTDNGVSYNNTAYVIRRVIGV